MTLSTRGLCSATAGHLTSGFHQDLSGVSIDSRSLQQGEAFFCLRGPNFDGHDFVRVAVSKGANAIVVDKRGARELSGLNASVALIVVQDTVHALGHYARSHRAGLDTIVVGITGSSGKTTTKEMLAAVLKCGGKTLATAGNLNNHLGVPLTLLRLTPEHRFAVIEMGMNARGEIAWLCGLSRPTVGVITTVGPAHLEGLGTVRNVAAAKGELLLSLPDHGLAVMPSDVEWPWVLTRGARAPLMCVGEGPTDEVRLTGAKETATGTAGWVHVGDEKYRLKLKMAGRHNLRNALLAIGAGAALGVDVEEAVEALGAVQPPKWRGEVRRLHDGGRVVCDFYNANPQSMQAAIRTFLKRSPDGLLVLGDMLELGEDARIAHELVGRFAVMEGARSIIGVGRLSAYLVQAARRAGLPVAKAISVHDADEAAQVMIRLRRKGQHVLLKASRGVALEAVLEVAEGR